MILRRSFLIVFLLLCIAHAMGQEYYEVQTNETQVMNSPLPGGQVMGVVNQHDVIEVTSACQGWARVVYNGATAYVQYQRLTPLGQGVPYETGSLEAWLAPKREGPPLTAEELQRQRKVEEKAARRAMPKKTVAELMALVNCAPDVPEFGVTLAYAGKWGFFVRGMFTGGMPDSYSDQDGLHTMLYKKNSSTLFTLTGGAMCRITPNIYGYAGMGYGKYGYDMTGESSSNSWWSYDEITLGAEGITADIGVVAKFGNFLLQGGYNHIVGDNNPSAYKGFYLGIGFAFDIKKRLK